MFSLRLPSVFKKSSHQKFPQEEKLDVAHHPRCHEEEEENVVQNKQNPTLGPIVSQPETSQGDDVLNAKNSDPHKHTPTFDDALLITLPDSYHHHVPVQHVVIKTGRNPSSHNTNDTDRQGTEQGNANTPVDRNQTSVCRGDLSCAEKKIGDQMQAHLYPQKYPYDDCENDDNSIHDELSFDVSVLGSTGSSTWNMATRHLIDHKPDDDAADEEEELWPEDLLRTASKYEPELLNDAALKNNHVKAARSRSSAGEQVDHYGTGVNPMANSSEINGQVFTHIGRKMFKAQRDRSSSFGSTICSKIHNMQITKEEPKKGKDVIGSSLPLTLSILLVSVFLYRFEMTFFQQARQNTDDSFQKNMADAVSCSNEHCNGNGACAHHLHVWKSFSALGVPGSGKTINFPTNEDGSIMEKNRCFCFDDFKGDRCDQGRAVKISSPYLHDKWIMNDYYVHRGMDFSSDDPICGVQAIMHDNIKFLQMFRFSTCEIDMKFRTSNEHKTYETWWGEIPFDFICDDGVLTGLSSHRDVRDDSKEDFLWVATCTHFGNTKIDLDTCDSGINGPGFDSNYSALLGVEYSDVNHLDVTCGIGKAVTGIKPTPSNGGSGGFKFRCCELMVDKNASDTDAMRGAILGF